MFLSGKRSFYTSKNAWPRFKFEGMKPCHDTDLSELCDGLGRSSSVGGGEGAFQSQCLGMAGFWALLV